MTTKITLGDIQIAGRKFDIIRWQIKEAIATLNPVEVVTPTNVKTEKEAWLENAQNGIFGNPSFEYDEALLDQTIAQRETLETLMTQLKTLEPDESDIASHFVWEMLCYALGDGIDTTYLAEAIKRGNDDDAADIITKKYGLPSEKNVSQALNVVLDNCSKGELEHKVKQTYTLPEENEQILKTKKLGAEAIKDMFDWTMHEYTSKTWPVIITDEATSIDVRDKSKYGTPVIVIPTKRKVPGMKLAELIGHEIECHWRSSINAERLGILKCDDELVYEGLAALKDKEFNRNFCGTFNLNSAYYVIAINEALGSHSFGSVASLIWKYLPESTEKREEKAWMYTYRVFRGISDTENRTGYAYTKDRAYFEGWLYAKMLEIHDQTAFLSFSTLNQKGFERLMEIVDIEDVEKSVCLDKHLQEKSIGKIMKNLCYCGTQAERLAAIC